MNNSIINAENIEVKADFTNFINENPYLFFRLAVITIVIIAGMWFFHRRLKNKKKTKVEDILLKILKQVDQILDFMKKKQGEK